MERKKDRCKRNETREHGAERKGELEREKERAGGKRSSSRTNAHTRGEKWHRAGRRTREHLAAPAKNFDRARNSVITPWGGNNDSLTSWSLPLFLNTIIRFLFSIASAAIFSITNSPCSRRSMCAGTRLLVVRYREMYVGPSRKFPTALKRLVPLRCLSHDLFQSTSTELHSVPTNHSMRCM